MSEQDAATRDALQQIEKRGSDLSQPMTIDFCPAVPNEAAGQVVANRANALGFETSVEQDAEDGTWTCYCTKNLVPAFETVVAIERRLDALARDVGGHADGFGTYGNVAGPARN